MDRYGTRALSLLATKYDKLRAHAHELVFIGPSLQLMKIKFRLRFAPLELPQRLWRPASILYYTYLPTYIYVAIYIYLYLPVYFTCRWQYQFGLYGFSSHVRGWSRGLEGC